MAQPIIIAVLLAMGPPALMEVINLLITSNCTDPVITGSTAIVMSEDSSPTPFSLTLNVTDDDPGTLTWSIQTAAGDGTASVSGTGASQAITYNPTANFNGVDNFTVRVTNGTTGLF